MIPRQPNEPLKCLKKLGSHPLVNLDGNYPPCNHVTLAQILVNMYTFLSAQPIQAHGKRQVILPGVPPPNQRQQPLPPALSLLFGEENRRQAPRGSPRERLHPARDGVSASGGPSPSPLRATRSPQPHGKLICAWPGPGVGPNPRALPSMDSYTYWTWFNSPTRSVNQLIVRSGFWDSFVDSSPNQQ